MHNQEKQRFTVIAGVTGPLQAPVKHAATRKAGWVVIILAAAVAMTVFSNSHFNVQAKTAWTQTPAPSLETRLPSVAYFPSQYVNQANDIEPPPPTF